MARRRANAHHFISAFSVTEKAPWALSGARRTP
jgi:hypothetical protein